MKQNSAEDGDPGSGIEIWSEYAETIESFVALETQWQVHAFSGAGLGLGYEAVPVCPDLIDVTDRVGVFVGLCTMERAVLLELFDE